jgi:hypothetical protein
METVYVSLVRDFLGSYLETTIGEGGAFADEGVLRQWLNENHRAWWCSVYRDKDTLFEGSRAKFWTLEEFERKIATSPTLYEYGKMKNREYREQG